MNDSFGLALAFVWQPGFDPPSDGDHVTPGDPGGETNGGVTATTWAAAVQSGIVKGALEAATRAQLAAVLRVNFWGAVCDALPPGLDLLFFNGRMMSGGFPKLLQQCVGMMGADVDGLIGANTIGVVDTSDARTLINALSGAHYAYLTRLKTWTEFSGGWTTRLVAAKAEALRLVGSVGLG